METKMSFSNNFWEKDSAEVTEIEKNWIFLVSFKKVLVFSMKIASLLYLNK